MGTWGTAIFSDDLAADVRDLFTDCIAEGLNVEKATERVTAEFKADLKDKDEALVFWLALAATQSKMGRLADDVRDKAIEIIDSGLNLRRWEKEAGKPEVSQRKKHLDKLRQILLGPQPKPKQFKRRTKSSTDFKAGDIAVYRLDDKTSVRFCVLQIWGDLGGNYAKICLLGLEDHTPFSKKAISLADTLGPHFTMISREPDDRITMIRRNVKLPKRNKETLGAWFHLAVNGWACRWEDFDNALESVLPKLSWNNPKITKK